MKLITSLILFLVFVFPAQACDCDWGGDFFTMSKDKDLVIKVKIVGKSKNGHPFDTAMLAEILTTFKGDAKQKVIRIEGDGGSDCRPYIREFKIGGIYYLSLNEYQSEYELNNCGETYLRIWNNRRVGSKDTSQFHPEVPRMKLKDFEMQLQQLNE